LDCSDQELANPEPACERLFEVPGTEAQDSFVPMKDTSAIFYYDVGEQRIIVETVTLE